MGWLDGLWKRRFALPPSGPAAIAFDAPQTRARHEALVRELASLADLRLSAVESQAREDGVTVTLRDGERRRVVTHPRHALDLDRLLRALDSLLPDGTERRLCAITREDLRTDHAVAFANGRELKLLTDDDWEVLSADPPADRGESIVDGLPVRAGVERWPDGSLKRAELAEDARVAGLLCAAGSTVVFADSFLLEATLARPVALRDCTLPAGARVYFHYRSTTIGLSKLEQGLQVKDLRLPAGSELELDRAGRLVGAVLGEAVSPPSGYRDRAQLPAGARVSFRDGRWELDAAPPSRD